MDDRFEELRDEWEEHFLNGITEERDKLVEVALEGGDVREQAMRVRHEEALAENCMRKMVKLREEEE